jgi:tetratricopeptide (TPR) repeat protein
VPGFYQEGFCFMATGDLRDLLSEARRALADRKVDAARALLGVFGEGADALSVSAGMKIAEFWRDAGEVLRDAGLAQASEAAWRRAGAAGLAPLVVRTQIAVAWMVAGEFDRILDDLKDLAASEAKNAVVANLYALALFENGRFDEALTQWEATARISAQTAGCPLSTQSLYLSLGAMALDRFLQERANRGAETTGETSRPERVNEGARITEAEIEQALLEWRSTEALEWLDAELARQAQPAGHLRLLRAWALGDLNRWREARTEMARLVEAEPQHVPAKSFLAQCLTRSGEPELALVVLENLAPSGPDDFYLHYFRGCAYRMLGRRAEALGCFRISFGSYFEENYPYMLLRSWEQVGRLLKRTPQPV